MTELKNKIVDITKSVTKTSGGIIKTTKLSIALANEESELKSIYVEIGKKVHEIYEYGGSLGKVFDEKYKDIMACEEKIKSIRNQLDMAKGTKTCPFCGKAASRDSEFCPRCGKSMGDVAAPEPKTSTEQYVAPFEENNNIDNGAKIEFTKNIDDFKTCSICGEKNGKTEKFCYYCGRML